MQASIFVDKVRIVTDLRDSEPVTVKLIDDAGSYIHLYLTAAITRKLTTELQKALAAI